ncbi:MAG: DUF6603 domain-containing protein [Mycobacteriaceae bacterium]
MSTPWTMADAAGTLLRAAVSYALARLRPLLTAQGLTNALNVGPPDDVDAVQQHLNTALAHVDAAATAIALEPPDGTTTGTHLWAALEEVRDAAARFGAPDLRSALVRLLTEEPPAGAVARFEMESPRAKWDKESLTVGWTKTAPAPPVDGMRLARVGLDVAVRPTGLEATLVLGGLGLDLAGGGDAVLASILGGPVGVTVDVDVTVSKDGVRTHGTAGPVSIPARTDFGVVALDDLRLSVGGNGPQVKLTLTARLTGRLGPLVALVDGLEVSLLVDPAALLSGATLPQASPGARVKAVGLSLDTGVARGGGYLARTPDGDGFGGVLELQLGLVDVKAFGMIRNRGGATSFVAVMSVEFTPAIELSHGFTLNGVGGILGQGVSINTAALAAGMNDGAIKRILFPPDPVAAAPQILATLASVFPPRPDGFVVGPLLALGWGHPTLVRLDVAVALALPDPVVVILGRARAAFPTPEIPVIDLRASLLAQLGGGMVLVRTQLEASRMGSSSVQGGFGVLSRGGGSPTVVLSAGGFHPRYTQVPGELVGLDRISSELAPPVGVQMRISGYVALTPNTLQLGGSVEIAYSAGVAAVRGSLALDVLVHFDPFALEADLTAKVDVEVLGKSVAGVDLSLHVRGPAPWVVQGRGKVHLPWPLPDPSISVGPIEFGDRADAPPQTPVSPLTVAVAGLCEPGAWRGRVRSGFVPPVVLAPVLRTIVEDPKLTPVEPWALLEATQRHVPLGMRLDRVNGSPAAPGPCAVRIAGDPTVGVVTVSRWSQVREAFATAQFVDLTDDEALGAPDFEDRVAGVVIDISGTRSLDHPGVEADPAYEDFQPFESIPRPSGRGAWFLLEQQNLALALASSASGASSLRASSRYAAGPRDLAVQPSSAVRVADLDTAVTLFAPNPDTTGLAAGFAPWTDAAAAARTVGVTTLNLTKTGW